MKNKYFLKWCSLGELDSIYEFGFKLVGNSHIDLETLKNRHQINQEIVRGIFDKNSNLLGYYIIYYLNQEAVDKIDNLEIINGRGLTNEFFVSSASEAKGLYIGMLGVTGFKARLYLINDLLRNIKYLSLSGSLTSVYTRGATIKGKKIIKDFGFVSLGNKSEISCLKFEGIPSKNRFSKHINKT